MGKSPDADHQTEVKTAPSARDAPAQTEFNGLIQHSFALRIPNELRPQYTRKDLSDSRRLLRALLETDANSNSTRFRLMPVTEMGEGLSCPGGRSSDESHLDHESSMIKEGITGISAHRVPFTEQAEGKYLYPLPCPLEWAGSGPKPNLRDPARSWEGWIPEEKVDGCLLPNDFLLVLSDLGSSKKLPPNDDPRAVSWLLCQLLAHRRSRLFGWSLERRIFNVLLPHALLKPSGCEQDGNTSGGWIVQPALSLFLAEQDCGFRSIFSLSLFMVPVDAASGSNWLKLAERKMTPEEIYVTVQAGWSVADSRPAGTRPLFVVSGPLCNYVSALDVDPPGLLDPTSPEAASETWSGSAGNGLRLREIAEAILFATTLRMVSGPETSANPQTREKLGDRVLVALSSSRASSVVVVDQGFNKKEQVDSRSKGSFVGALRLLMEKVGHPIVIADGKDDYRLDRSFFDEDDYAIGVLPANRCIVVTSDSGSQRLHQDSALLEAGWIAYMVIGAATATGMLRSIYHEIEQVDKSKPGAIAAIEREVVVDLHEIYDLDITWEQYRHRYGLLREAFGITRDYKALQSKLEALSRETTTRFESRSDARLTWLTAAIVFLTLVVVIVTVLAK